jgi:hypothetical protein
VVAYEHALQEVKDYRRSDGLTAVGGLPALKYESVPCHDEIPQDISTKSFFPRFSRSAFEVVVTATRRKCRIAFAGLDSHMPDRTDPEHTKTSASLPIALRGKALLPCFRRRSIRRSGQLRPSSTRVETRPRGFMWAHFGDALAYSRTSFPGSFNGSGCGRQLTWMPPHPNSVHEGAWLSRTRLAVECSGDLRRELIGSCVC